MQHSEIDALICEAVSGAPGAAQRPSPQALAGRANAQGMGMLLFDALSRSGAAAPALKTAALEQAVWEMGHQQALAAALAKLAAAGIHPLIFKGTALAYSLYPDPALRPRGDTDMLILSRDREAADQVLAESGWQRATAVSGQFVSYQASYSIGASGAQHSIDLHWKINNGQVLAELFTYQELMQRSLLLERFGPHARGAGIVDSLLIACMHRLTHKFAPHFHDGIASHDPDRLIWLYDIHLIASTLTGAQWQQAQALAQDKGLIGVVSDGLAAAAARFGGGTGCERWKFSAGRNELPMRYFSKGMLGRQWMDLMALRPVERLAWLREMVFPPPDYMRARYEQSSASWLPWLYARRAVSGALKLLQLRGG